MELGLRCSYYRPGVKGQCKKAGVMRLRVAPNGTAYPQRASVLLCGLHYAMHRKGTLQATYIETGEAKEVTVR